MRDIRNILFLCLFFSSALVSQNVIHLTVKTADGEVIPGVTAHSIHRPYAMVSDFNGKIVWDLPGESDSVRFDHLNYDPIITNLVANQKMVEIVLQKKVFTLGTAEIISSWTKPQSIIVHSTLDASMLAKRHVIQDVPYMLQNLPSSVSTSDAGNGVGYTSLRIRGLDPTQINVLINGVPLNDAESQNVFWVDLPDLIASASAVQVQRGIGLSGAGQVAFGSSVLINTNLSRPKAFLTTELAAGTFNTSKLSVSAGSGNFKNGWNVQGRISRVHSDGYIDRARSDLWSGNISVSQISQHRSLRFLVFDGLEKTYQAWYGVPIQFIQNNRTYNAAGTEKTTSPYHNQIDYYRQTHFQGIHLETLNENWSLQNTIHFTPGSGYYEEYKANQIPLNYGLSGDKNIDLVRRKNLVNDFAGSIHALHYEDKKVDVLLGASWNVYKGLHIGEVIQTNENVLPTPSRYYHLKATKWTGMAFGKAEYILNSIHLIGDLQFRTVDYGYQPENSNSMEPIHIHHQFLSPKLGMTFQINPKHQLFAFSGIAHREPNREDYTKAGIQLPKAEQVWDHEAGWRWSTSLFNLEQNFYGMVYKNQLIPTGELNEVGAYIRSNVPASYRIGSETTLTWNPCATITVRANANFSQNKTRSITEYIDNWDTGLQENRIVKDMPIAFSPSHVLNLGMESKLIDHTSGAFNHLLVLEGNFRSIGSQYLDGTGTEYSKLQGYDLLDASLHHTVLKKGKSLFDVRVQCNNVLNVKYVSNGWLYRFKSASYNPVPDDPYAELEENDTYHLKGLFPQAGRTVTVSLRIYI